MSLAQHNAAACGAMRSGAGDFVPSCGFTSFFVNQEINKPAVALALCWWVLAARVRLTVFESLKGCSGLRASFASADIIPGPAGYVISETKHQRGVSGGVTLCHSHGANDSDDYYYPFGRGK